MNYMKLEADSITHINNEKKNSKGSWDHRPNKHARMSLVSRRESWIQTRNANTQSDRTFMHRWSIYVNQIRKSNEQSRTEADSHSSKEHVHRIESQITKSRTQGRMTKTHQIIRSNFKSYGAHAILQSSRFKSSMNRVLKSQHIWRAELHKGSQIESP